MAAAAGGHEGRGYDGDAFPSAEEVAAGDGMSLALEHRHASLRECEAFSKVAVALCALRPMISVTRLEDHGIEMMHERQKQVVDYYLDRLVFPDTMEHRGLKLAANGQDVGGDMLFEVKLGFSGTPSDLLPLELGRFASEMVL